MLRFLAVSMPRRRGDGGLLVLPVWSTCSGLFWVFAISFSRFQLFGLFGQILSFPTFWVFWSDFVQNLVETYPDSGAENCEVLGSRFGDQIWCPKMGHKYKVH